MANAFATWLLSPVKVNEVATLHLSSEKAIFTNVHWDDYGRAQLQGQLSALRYLRSSSRRSMKPTCSIATRSYLDGSFAVIKIHCESQLAFTDSAALSNDKLIVHFVHCLERGVVSKYLMPRICGDKSRIAAVPASIHFTSWLPRLCNRALAAVSI